MLSSSKEIKEDSIEINSRNKLMKPYKIHELLSPKARVRMMGKFEKEPSVTSRGPLSQTERNATYREGPFGQMRNSLVNLKENIQKSHQPAPLKTAVPSKRNIQIDHYNEHFTFHIPVKGSDILGGVDELPEDPTVMGNRDPSK